MVKIIDSKEQFDAALKEAGSKLVVVDFFAEWCGPCKMIAPKIEEFAKIYTNVVFLKVDIDEAEDLAQLYEIKSIPTFFFFKNGEKIDSMNGANESKLLSKIDLLK
ncbi:thioredoxin-like [Latimeria chalumnae]|uniref:thioredoxin-like n=1 Tax=Latimeria chalumnae TaxID=7897 RepID=UPI00313D3E4A